MHATLRALETLISSPTLPALERQRAERDLERIRTRLTKGDYARSAFGTNTFDIPDRMLELHSEVDFYARIGKLWSTLLDAVGARHASEVLDLCPGGTPKVELGLYYLGYRGPVRIVDKDREALLTLERFLNLFSPALTLEPVVGDLFATNLAPADIVTANHVIDDWLIDEACARGGETPAQIYGSEERLGALWRDIVAQRDRVLRDLAPRFAEGLARLVRSGGRLVMTQYPSYAERMLGADAAVALCREVFRAVGTHLGGLGFSDLSVTATAGLVPSDGAPFSAEHCLVMARGRG